MKPDQGNWWSVLHEIEGFQYFENQKQAESACREQNLCFTQLPVGSSARGLVTIDASVSAAETGQPGILFKRENGYWETFDHQQTRAYSEKASFDHAASRVLAAAQADDQDAEISLLASLFRCPIYTARNKEQVEQAMARVKFLHELRGAESLSYRLSAAGFDGEQWRIVGAERAIASKTRDALVALSGAHYLGAKLDKIVLPASQSLGNSGWKWANAILKIHKRAAKG